MSVTTRPMPRPRQRAPGEAGSRRIQWWHYLLAACALGAVVGLGYGVRALWFSMTHIRTTYAWVSGVVVSLSAKDDTRVRQLLVRTGDRVRKGDIVAILDNADAEAAVEQARAANAVVGTFVESPDEAQAWVGLGVQYICYSVDVGIFYQACKEIVGKLRRG